MNLKERGITIGDLLIVVLIIVSTTFLIKKINKDSQTTFNSINSEILALRN